MFLTTTAGAWFGVWVREKIKGRVAKEVWYAQEAWKEKYRLYTVLIGAVEQIAESLWNIVAEQGVLPATPPGTSSTEADGLRLFPGHRDHLDRESKAIEQIAAASVGAELILTKEAQEALDKIRASRTRSMSLINMSYWQRINERQQAATEAKEILIKAARNDLLI